VIEVECIVLVQLESAGVYFVKATLRTSPSSGQAATISQLRLRRLPACHSRAAFEGGDFQGRCHSLAATQAAWIKGSARIGSGSSGGLLIHTFTG